MAFEDNFEPLIERYLKGNPEAVVDEFMRGLWGEQWQTELPSMVPGGVEQAERDAAAMFEHEWPALEYWEFDEEKTDAYSGPVLYMRASGSHAEESELVQSWFPHTEGQVIEGVDHNFQMKDPQPVAERIANFLRRQRP